MKCLRSNRHRAPQLLEGLDLGLLIIAKAIFTLFLLKCDTCHAFTSMTRINNLNSFHTNTAPSVIIRQQTITTAIKGSIHNHRVINHNVQQLRIRSTIPTDQRSSTSLSVANVNIASHISGIVSAISSITTSGNALKPIQELFLSTPPIIYFSAFIIAGFGVPISEDALCILLGGTMLPAIWNENPILRNKLLIALYTGVVLSDIISFMIGKIMRMGVLEPIRKKINMRSERIEFCEDEEGEEQEPQEAYEEVLCEIPTSELRKTDRIVAIIESVGDYAGLVIRLAAGMRLPMMLAVGFSGKVPFGRYVIGTSIGAIFSLSLQLCIGYSLRNNSAGIIAAVASISTFPLVIPTLFAFVSWINVSYKRWRLFGTSPFQVNKLYK